ncbi:MAG TPA: bacillithiol system redox-active protein YtxJ [Blastocatellia bacterium]|nr:bacillithiol system redox-active protein YtxJ [Blastocatellia bacterium]
MLLRIEKYFRLAPALLRHRRRLLRTKGYKQMQAKFVKLDSIDKLDALFERSREQSVLLFKHSATCGISFTAYREMSAVNAEVNLVVVQTERQISNEIARRTGIGHQSPQAIVLRDGKARYHASHHHISSAAISELLSEG